MAGIEVRDVHFGYDGRPVLMQTRVTIASGERVALLGANGAGKTTLLKLLAGVLTPSAGSIVLQGQSVQSIPRQELARKIAVVPQEFVVPFAFTAKEIVQLGRTPHRRWLGTSAAADREAVERAMEITSTAEFSSRTFNELSGGERRRVMIAMALAQQPEILLLDEPTQQLDIARQSEILDLISQLNRREGVTVIAAMHDLNLAATYFDRMIFLYRGSVVADGSPQEMLRSEFVQMVYNGNVEVVHVDRHGATPIVLPARHRGSPHGSEKISSVPSAQRDSNLRTEIP